MCGRYNLITDAAGLITAFEIGRQLVDPVLLRPRFNIAPSQDVPIIRMNGGVRELVPARWGLVPSWAKTPKSDFATINARAETVADKPLYRTAFKSRRCLIPATGFYEWQPGGKQKTPMHIHRPHGELFAFAGLWDHWEQDGVGFDSCSIIVTTANPALKPIHDRMPVILNEAHYGTWLNVTQFSRPQLLALLIPYGGTLQTDAISRYVNSPKNEGPGCIAGISEP